MHHVNLRLTSEGLDDAVRATLARGCAELLRRVLGADPATTTVVIDEMPLAGIGMGGLGIEEYRARQLAAATTAAGAPNFFTCNNNLNGEMNMMKLWGRERGLCVKKVLWCLEELKLDFERIDAGKQYGVIDTEEYLRLNRNGLVPTLKDGDFVLWESNAIMRYLALEYGGGALYPTAPRPHGDVNRWLDWQNGALWPDIAPAFVQMIRTPAAQRNHELVKSASAKLAKNWATADEYLANKTFICGADFTLADIALGVMAETWLYLDLPDKPALPHFSAWYARLQSRPGFKKYVNVPPEADTRQQAG